MTEPQKIVIKKLLTGHFLRKVSRKERSWYVLYDSQYNPKLKVRAATIENLDRYMDPQKPLWKKKQTW
jgi:hypothetical protein